jgi:hypothetical protein
VSTHFSLLNGVWSKPFPHGAYNLTADSFVSAIYQEGFPKTLARHKVFNGKNKRACFPRERVGFRFREFVAKCRSENEQVGAMYFSNQRFRGPYF